MSDWTTYDLERMAAGEIDTPDDASERVDALRALNAATLERFPESEFVPRIRAAVPRETRARRAPVFLAVAGIAAAVLAGVWLRPPASVPADEPGVRLKGSALRLHVYKQTESGELRLSDGDAVAAGDIVQAKFGLDGGSWVALFSVDGAGVVTPLAPPQLDGEAIRYEGGTHIAPTATQLDDAPDFERFVVVACPKPFIVRDLAARVKDGAELAPCSVERLELRKR